MRENVFESPHSKLYRDLKSPSHNHNNNYYKNTSSENGNLGTPQSGIPCKIFFGIIILVQNFRQSFKLGGGSTHACFMEFSTSDVPKVYNYM